MAEFKLASQGFVADFLVEQSNDLGVRKIADKVREDIGLVTGQYPMMKEKIEEVGEYVIVAGTYGKSQLISQLEQEGRIHLEGIKGKREVYQVAFIEWPWPHVKEAMVICGSDKRGTIYGLFQISDWLGVSPWVYWADVKPKKQNEVYFTQEDAMVSKEPSVKYRGFFINDEWPSFGSWTFEHFGGFTAQMYDKVFELLLRLKGNYLWPAMWSSSFSLDGPGLKNAELADEYGIVICFSHHEPCLRSSEEWDIYKGADTEYGQWWNYYTNKEGLLNYWRDGLKRSGKYESVITIGMRGERDTSMLGPDSTLRENIDLLKDIITEQRKLIAEYVNPNLEEVPQVLALYKEVEAYFYGDEEAEGLKDWKTLDGVTLMLCEDNFGNMRTLPEASKREREGGWGMYYHFDYHGAPISYEWVNSTPLTKVWEQMSMAYDYGVREIWVVNVGDLKPQELPLSYFMALAYDFEKWGTHAPNQTKHFTEEWVKQQFGAVFSHQQQSEVVSILEGYSCLNGRCRPEVLSSKTYHPSRYHEAERVFNQVELLSQKADKLLEEVSKSAYDAYYELVYFPAIASFNLIKMQIYAGMNQYEAVRGKVVANIYGDQVVQCIERDRALTDAYHHLAEGKWNGMASSAHIGFTHWNDEDWRYPVRQIVEPVAKPRMIVSVAGQSESYTSGSIMIQDGLYPDCQRIEVYIDNGGKESFTYEVEEGASWLSVSKSKGKVDLRDTLVFYINKERLTQKEMTTVTIKGAEAQVQLCIEAQPIQKPDLPMTFMESQGYTAIEAEHFAKSEAAGEAKWCLLEGYGRTLSGLKVYPTTQSFKLGEAAPTLMYRVWVEKEGQYTLEVQAAPSNPLRKKSSLGYGLKVNDGKWKKVEMVGEDFAAGDWNDQNWCTQVLENINRSYAVLHLQQGLNEIYIQAMDAGVVLERLVICPEGKRIPSKYLGPEESYHTL